MSYTYRITPPSNHRNVVPAHGGRSVTRRVRRFALALFNNFPETILLVLGLGTMAVALIMSKFATWPPQFTN
jgi:hypothetical protein